MRHVKITMLLFAMIGLLSLAGCQRNDSGLSSEQEQMASRLDDIAAKSGGDWEKVSPADRNYLVNDVSSGDESAAKKLLAGRSGHLPKGAPAQKPTRP